MKRKHLTLALAGILAAVLLASFLLISPISQSLVKPAKVTCSGGIVHVRMLDQGIRSYQIDELVFSHDSSVILDSNCAEFWEGLRYGQSVPVLEYAYFAGNDISNYIRTVQRGPGPTSPWRSGVVVTDSDALVSYLYNTYGIVDTDEYDYEVMVMFWEGNCNTDGQCADDEYCMVASHDCVKLQCDDGEICTLDAAQNHECTHSDIEGCCHSDSDCSEDEVCRSNVCTEGCREIPEKPCEQAAFLDYPECSWDESPCQVHNWTIIFIVIFVAVLAGAIGLAVWWLRRR